ncbi:hypothetical protein SAMN05442782_1669 [Streptomyces sp. OK228]|nr:hypothetical protein SAMN05442782_1669 [Streptomyces sp. OK228]
MSRLALQERRAARGRYAEGVQEAARHAGGVDRGGSGVEAAQVSEELAVGEAVGHAVREVQGQRGLAHPGGAGDRRDHDRAATGHLIAQQRVELFELAGAPGEVPYRCRQLLRHGRLRRDSQVGHAGRRHSAQRLAGLSNVLPPRPPLRLLRRCHAAGADEGEADLQPREFTATRVECVGQSAARDAAAPLQFLQGRLTRPHLQRPQVVNVAGHTFRRLTRSWAWLCLRHAVPPVRPAAQPGQPDPSGPDREHCRAGVNIRRLIQTKRPPAQRRRLTGRERTLKMSHIARAGLVAAAVLTGIGVGTGTQ